MINICIRLLLSITYTRIITMLNKTDNSSLVDRDGKTIT